MGEGGGEGTDGGDTTPETAGGVDVGGEGLSAGWGLSRYELRIMDAEAALARARLRHSDESLLQPTDGGLAPDPTVDAEPSGGLETDAAAPGAPTVVSGDDNGGQDQVAAGADPLAEFLQGLSEGARPYAELAASTLPPPLRPLGRLTDPAAAEALVQWLADWAPRARENPLQGARELEEGYVYALATTPPPGPSPEAVAAVLDWLDYASYHPVEALNDIEAGGTQLVADALARDVWAAALRELQAGNREGWEAKAGEAVARIVLPDQAVDYSLAGHEWRALGRVLPDLLVQAGTLTAGELLAGATATDDLARLTADDLRLLARGTRPAPPRHRRSCPGRT